MSIHDRGAARIPVVIEGVIESEADDPVDVLCTDISLTGAFVVAPVNLPRETDCVLQLNVEEREEPVRLRAQIVRLDASGMGMRFAEEQDESFEYVRSLFQ